MKLIENYIVCGKNIFSNGKLLFADECCNLAQYTANSELLEILSQDKDWRVRESVAENLSTPTNILEILSQDNDYIVRWSVALNPSTPKDILERLSQDKDWRVRESVAYHPYYNPHQLIY